jgi:hypothetical protein
VLHEAAEKQPVREGEMELVWTARRSSLEILVVAIFAAIVLLTLAYVGDALSKMGTDADLEEPVEVRVISPDDVEPFVVCTIRPRVRHCQNLDLKVGQP